MVTAEEISATHLDPAQFAQLTINDLCGLYVELNEGTTKEDFYRDYMGNFMRIAEDHVLSGDVAVSQYLSATTKFNIAEHTAFCMGVTAFYSIEALRSYEKGNRDVAWAQIAEARFYLAHAYATVDSEKSANKLISVQRRAQATLAAKAKFDAEFGVRKIEVEKLAHSLRPNSGWKSRSDATRRIIKKLEENDKFEIKSWGNAEKTIFGWLTNHPDAATLFPPKTRSRRVKPPRAQT